MGTDEDYFQVGQQALAEGQHALAIQAFRSVLKPEDMTDSVADLLAQCRFQLAVNHALDELRGVPEEASGFVEVLSLLEAAGQALKDPEDIEIVRDHVRSLCRGYINARYQIEAEQQQWTRLIVLVQALETVTDSDEERAWARRELAVLFLNRGYEQARALQAEAERFVEQLT